MNIKNISAFHILIVLIIILAASLGAMRYYMGEDETSPRVVLVYELNMTSNNTVSVLWPVPIASVSGDDAGVDNISALMDHLTIVYGNADYKLVSTTHGPALNITFSGSIHLKAEKIFDSSISPEPPEYFFNDLTMKTSKGMEYFVFSTNSSVMVNHFICYRKTVGEDADFPFYFEIRDIFLDKGWLVIGTNI